MRFHSNWRAKLNELVLLAQFPFYLLALIGLGRRSAKDEDLESHMLKIFQLISYQYMNPIRELEDPAKAGWMTSESPAPIFLLTPQLL